MIAPFLFYVLPIDFRNKLIINSRRKIAWISINNNAKIVIKKFRFSKLGMDSNYLKL